MRDLLARLRGMLFRISQTGRGSRICIGRGLRLYCKLEICGTGRVRLGDDCVVAGIPGDNRHYVTLYTHSPDAEISIGARARLYAGRISSSHGISIGDDLLMEESGIMDTDFHAITPDRGPPQERPEQCRVRIGDRVSIGARSIIAKGVSVGDDVSIYPGSIVTRNIPAGLTIAGNPAKPLRVGAEPESQPRQRRAAT